MKLGCILSRSLLILLGLSVLAPNLCLFLADDILREDLHYYKNPRELIVTRDGAVINRLQCERIDLPYPDAPPTHQVLNELGRTRNGDFYVATSAGKMFHSSDGGRSWTSWNVQLGDQAGIGPFCVLADDTFLAARENCFFHSPDKGRTWKAISELKSDPFDRVDINFLTQLRDGTVLSPVNRYNLNATAGQGTTVAYSQENQYVFRSNDQGRSWKGGGDANFWRTLTDAGLDPAAVSLQSRFPGTGGTFPGCWETQVTELADGRLIAAFRYSGKPAPWHLRKSQEWGMEVVRQRLAGVVPGVAEDDRILKYVFLGDSYDGGKTWQSLRPVLDAKGKSVLYYGSLHGQVVQVPDGRLVLIHVRRYPRENQQVLARVSEDDGKTWLRDEYRIIYGSGYPRSLVLEDGTIVTVSGSTLTTPGGRPPKGGRYSAQCVRWRLPAKARQ